MDPCTVLQRARAQGQSTPDLLAALMAAAQMAAVPNGLGGLGRGGRGGAGQRPARAAGGNGSNGRHSGD